MNKYYVVLILALSLIIQTLFGGYFTGLLVSTGLAKRIKLFEPQTPVVIERTTEVVVRDFGDLQALYEDVRDYSVKVTLPGNQAGFQGLVLTSDGILAAAATLPQSAAVNVAYQDKILTGRVLATNPAFGISYIKVDSGFDKAPDFLEQDKIQIGLKLGLVQSYTQTPILRADYLASRYYPSQTSVQELSRNSDIKLDLQLNGAVDNSIVAAHEGQVIGLIAANKLIVTNQVFSYDLQQITAGKPIARPYLGVNVMIDGNEFVVSRMGKDVFPSISSVSTILREGDRITSINGSDNIAQALERLLSDDDGTIDIQFKRGNETLKQNVKYTVR